MKKIRIKLVGFPPKWDYNANLVFAILKKHYDIEFVFKDADYVFCSCFGEPYEYLSERGVRIFLSGENYIPDFNFIDYGISSYPINFLDRHFRLPYFMWLDFNKALDLEKNVKFRDSDVLNKKYFANFIFSHESENGVRGNFFNELQKYKRVESCGSYLNNMPDHFTVLRSEKNAFQSKCKFTLCFESLKTDGFITEKILDAFYSNTIPIYYGSTDIEKIFNKNSFINCTNSDSFSDVINRIIELDNDDEKFKEILNQQVFAQADYASKLIIDLEKFLCSIFDQPKQDAYRRHFLYAPEKHFNYILDLKKKQKNVKKLSCWLNKFKRK